MSGDDVVGDDARGVLRAYACRCPFDSATTFAESAFATSVCVPGFGLPVQLTLAEPPAAMAGVASAHTCTPSSLNCVVLAPAEALPVFDTVAA